MPADQVVDFQTLYGTHCIGCHGAGGSLGPAPPLNDPLFRAGISREELVRTITSGRRGTPMPGFAPEAGGTLTTTQIEVLIAEIKGVPYRVDRAETANGVELRVVPDPAGQTPAWGPMPGYPHNAPKFQEPEDREDARDPAQVGRGDRVFEQACSGCHGPDGRGADAGAINDPAFLSLISNRALRRIIITGRPDLGMPDYSDKHDRGDDFQPLTTADVDDLVAFLKQWRSPSKSQE
ncbi:MAG TPA: c-type cytochrome [Planctomycetaceae bacterium]|nr:c-type cytochrome [Planctomycetaceae bacterium]